MSRHEAAAQKIAVDFECCAAQSEAYRRLDPTDPGCNDNTVGLAFGRGAGKSEFARLLMWLHLAHYDRNPPRVVEGKEYPGVRIAMVLPTLIQFKRTGHERAIIRALSPSGPWGWLGADINLSKWSIEFPGDSNIQIYGAENIDAARGDRKDFVVVDEGDDIDKTAFDAVISPWFTEPGSLRRKLIMGTPRRGRYGLLWRSYMIWPHGDANNEAVPKCFSFHATGYDNPKHVSRQYLEDERRKLASSPGTFEREYLCNFDSAEGLVYPFFDVKFHVRLSPPSYAFDEYIVGFDYGFSEPCAFIVIGITGSGKDAICHVVHEEYVYQRSDTELVSIAMGIEASFKNRDGTPVRWYCDHHLSTVDAFKENHVRAELAVKGPGSVESGVSFVADAIFVRQRTGADGLIRKWSQFYVAPECKNTIQEFGLYRRKRDPRDREVVLDNIDTSKNDHCFVAGTMVQTDAGEVPIEAIRVGDVVATRGGWQRVEASVLTRRQAETCEVTLSNGRTLRGTPDHRIWTENRGWSRLDSLRYTDTLVGWVDRATATRRLAPVRAVAVRQCELADVYDLTVAVEHEFFANGVVVSNCMDAIRYALVGHFGGVDNRVGVNDLRG